MPPPPPPRRADANVASVASSVPNQREEAPPWVRCCRVPGETRRAYATRVVLFCARHCFQVYFVFKFTLCSSLLCVHFLISHIRPCDDDREEKTSKKKKGIESGFCVTSMSSRCFSPSVRMIPTTLRQRSGKRYCSLTLSIQMALWMKKRTLTWGLLFFRLIGKAPFVIYKQTGR